MFCESLSQTGSESAEELGCRTRWRGVWGWNWPPHRERSIPEVVIGRLHAPVPRRRRVKARGSDREVELEGTLSALRPGREPLPPRGWSRGHHAAPAECCGRPGHRHHPRSDLWYVPTQPRLRPALAALASVFHQRDSRIGLSLSLATSPRTRGVVTPVPFGSRLHGHPCPA